MTKETEENGPEMLRLLDRLYGDPKRKVKNFSITPGPNWNSLTLEEKAATINKMLDSLNDATIVDEID